MRPLMNQQGTGRPRTAGFTMVELLVAITIGSILMIAIYQVLVTNQRVSAVQTEQILTQQTMRAGVDLLAQELREVSVSGATVDLVTAEQQRIQLRAPRAFGIVCNPPGEEDLLDGLSGQLVVRPIGRRFADAPPYPVYIFADGDRNTDQDDEWILMNVNDLPDPTGTDCPGGQPAQILVVTAGALPSVPATRTGAAVRAFHDVEYHLETSDGDVYLARTRDAGDPVRLVGPLDPDDGLEFVYLDANGNDLGSPAPVAQVRRIQVTLRASSDAIWAPGAGAVGGELTTTVFLRN